MENPNPTQALIVHDYWHAVAEHNRFVRRINFSNNHKIIELHGNGNQTELICRIANRDGSLEPLFISRDSSAFQGDWADNLDGLDRLFGDAELPINSLDFLGGIDIIYNTMHLCGIC